MFEFMDEAANGVNDWMAQASAKMQEMWGQAQSVPEVDYTNPGVLVLIAVIAWLAFAAFSYTGLWKKLEKVEIPFGISLVVGFVIVVGLVKGLMWIVPIIASWEMLGAFIITALFFMAGCYLIAAINGICGAIYDFFTPSPAKGGSKDKAEKSK